MLVERIIALPIEMSFFFSFCLFGVMNTFENLTEAMNLLLKKLFTCVSHSQIQYIILECSLALEALRVCEPQVRSPCSRMFSL